MQGLGVRIAGFMRKPFGEEYVFIDDKLLVPECATSLGEGEKLAAKDPSKDTGDSEIGDYTTNGAIEAPPGVCKE